MGMPVDKSRKSGRIAYDILTGIRRGTLVHAHMPHAYDIIGFFGGVVNGVLNDLIEFRALVALGKAPHDFPVVIHEIRGRGFRDGFRRRHAEKSHFFSVRGRIDFISREKRRIVLRIDNIAGNVIKIRPFNYVFGPVHIIIKLVIAQRRGGISGGVHEIHNRMTVVVSSVGRALNMIPRVHQKIGVDFIPVSGYSRIAQAADRFRFVPLADFTRIVNISMNIICIQNLDFIIIRARRENDQREDH